MRINKILSFTFLFFYSCCSFMAQTVVLAPLGGNSILMHKKQTNTLSQKPASVSAMFLPFFDEFSYNGPWPDPNKWDMSQSIFVNRTYPIAPPTIGVATFDGLDRGGYPYNPLATSSGSYLSDTLLSVPLRLDSMSGLQLTPADSVYLSFYYQLKGRGDTPETNDELRLLFFAPTDSLDFNISPVWSHPGTCCWSPNDTNFHRVMILMDDTTYFKNGFRFAFVNFGTQSGAIDHWHVDQIYLNKGRSRVDTLFQDVSFVYDEKSLLKNFSQMPYWQFAGLSDMKDSVSATLRNNKNTKSGSTWSGAVNITTEYQILDNAGAQVLLNTGGTNNVFNYDSIGYCKDRALINPSLGSYAYNSGAFPSATSFQLKFYLKGGVGGDIVHANDTAYFRQDFENYYSYDDGTAEAGYKIEPAVGGETSVKYTLNTADVLRSVDIFFDPVFNVGTLLSDQIRLTVRADSSGFPGHTLLIDSAQWMTPIYHTGYDVFIRFQLSQSVPLAAGTTFYIGVVQQFTTGIGIGYDLNNDNHKKVYFNFHDGTGWQQTSLAFKGSLMLRPVLGDSLAAVGVQSFAEEKQNVHVYPNPASDEIFISAEDRITKVLITDVLGNTLIEERNPSQKISVSALPNGLYLLRMTNSKGHSSVQKLIISR
jgi:hypothetical protein